MKTLLLLTLFGFLLLNPGAEARAESATELLRKSREAIGLLYATNPEAEVLGRTAAAVLIFPEVRKGGLGISVQVGEGTLFRRLHPVGYFNITSISGGLDLGVQKIGYALFFMDEDALGYFRASGGFEVGTAPAIVTPGEGVIGGLSTTTLQRGIHAFSFNPQGLMVSVGLQATKISEIRPSK